MLNRHPTEEDLKSALRIRICNHCHLRSTGSEDLPANVARPCENACEIFRALPRIHQLTYLDPMVADLHHAAERVLSEICPACPNKTHGEKTQSCPVRRYRKQVLETIEQQMKHAQG